MVILNDKKFAENDKEFVSSLFTDKTCVGYVRKNKKSITIMDHQKNKVGVLNRHGVLCHASKLDDGKWWYNLATIDLIGEYDSYMKQVEECKNLIYSLSA